MWTYQQLETKEEAEVDVFLGLPSVTYIVNYSVTIK